MKALKRGLCVFLAVIFAVLMIPQSAVEKAVSAEASSTAKQSAADNMLDVYYVTNGGTLSGGFTVSDVIGSGETLTLPTAEQINRTGYEFEGWYDNVNLEGEPLTEVKAEDKELNFYAKWKARYYTLTIPDTKQLAGNGTLELKADCGGFYENDRLTVNVRSANDWELNKKGSSVGYTISGTKQGEALENGDVAASFDESGEKQLYYSVEESTGKALSGSADILTFSVDLKTTEYTVIFDTKGGVAIPTAKYPAGTLLTELPAAEKTGSIFSSWCYDSACTEKVQSGDELTSNITLYASYFTYTELEEEEGIKSLTSYDNQPDFTIKLTASESMTIAEVKQAITLIDTNDKNSTDFYEVIGSGTEFQVYGKNNRFTAGHSYKLTLNDDRLSFSDNSEQEGRATEYDFSIYKETVIGMELSDSIKYIKVADITSLTVNSEALASYEAADFIVKNEDSSASSVKTVGVFTYKGSEQLNVGDTVGVYQGELPNGDAAELITYNPDVSFIQITQAMGGGSFKYTGAETTDVIFTPDVFPVPRAEDTDGDDTNYSIRVPEKYFVYEKGTYMDELGMDEDTSVDAGDYVLLYDGTMQADGTGISNPSYGQITDCTTENDASGLYYVVEYITVSQEAMQNEQSTYYSRDIEEEEYEDIVDEEKVKAEVLAEVEESGFADEAAKYMALSLMATDSFNEIMEESGIDASELVLASESTSSTAENKRVEVKIKSLTPYLNNELEYYEGKSGMRLTLKIVVEVTVHASSDADLKFTISCEFQQELRIRISVDAETEWSWFGIIPYISDYNCTAVTDIYEYSGLQFQIDITIEEADKTPGKYFSQLKEAADSFKDTKEKLEGLCESLGKIIGTEDDSALSAELAEKYAEMIDSAGDLDYVDVVEKQMFKANFTLLYIIDLSVGADAILSVKVNLTIGTQFYYAAAKRYTLNIKLRARTVTQETLDLEPEVFEYRFYAMGMMGLRAGIQLNLQIGLISTEIDSIGIKARVGVYFEMYGYFYYVYRTEKLNGVKTTSSNYGGALYFELGVFLHISFVAQLGGGNLEADVEIFDKQWPLIHFGEQKNVIDFVWDNSTLDSVTMKFSERRAYLPDNLFTVEYLDMKEGAETVDLEGEEQVVFFTERYEYEDFEVEITNSKFVYNKEQNRIEVNVADGDRYLEGDMIITYKAPLVFRKTPIQRRIHLQWDNLASGYYISFDTGHGSVVDTIEGAYNSSVTAPANPTRDGYTFTGWYSDAECTKSATVPKTMPSYNTTLYAGWKEAVSQYRIEYYKETLSGSYELEETVTKKGKTESTVNAELKDYEGFTTPAQQQVTVKADGSAVVKYYYSRNSYTATYHSGVEGNETKTVSVKYGDTVPTPIFGITGYDFSKWDKSLPTTMPANDIEVTAQWKPSEDTKYTVKYYLQNANGLGYTLDTVKYYAGTTGSSVTADKLAYDGYSANDGISTLTGNIAADGSTELSVYYDRNTYTITYSVGEGNAVTATQHRFGSDVYPVSTTRTDYVFGGWYTDSSCTEKFDGVMPANDLTLYAYWVQSKIYLVKHYWMNVDGTWPETTADVEYLFVQEGAASVTAVPKTKVGFTLDADKSGSLTRLETDLNDNNDMELADTESSVINVYYTRNKHSLKVYYNNGSSNTDEELYYGAAVSLNPSRTGYTFTGWFSDEACTESYTLAATMPDKAVTVYAGWSVNTYRIYYNYNDGKTAQSNTAYEYGAAVEAAPTPTRTGYTFSGWYTDSEFKNAYSKPATMPANNIMLYARWTPITYTITYDVGAGTNSALNVTSFNVESDTITIFAPTRTNYDFTGWNVQTSSDGKTWSTVSTGTMSPSITKGTTCYYRFTATYKGVECTIAFNLVATENTSVTPTEIFVNYNDALTNLDAGRIPTRKGYTFNGFWLTETDESDASNQIYDADGKPKSSSGWTRLGITTEYAKNVTTLYAHWITKTYTIYFRNADGVARGSDTSMTVKFSDKTVTLPTRTGISTTYTMGENKTTIKYNVLGYSLSNDASNVDIQYDAGATIDNDLNNVDFSESITLYTVMFPYYVEQDAAKQFSSTQTTAKPGIPVDDEEDTSYIYLNLFDSDKANDISYWCEGSSSDSTNFQSAKLTFNRIMPQRDKLVLQRYSTGVTTDFYIYMKHVDYNFHPSLIITFKGTDKDETIYEKDDMGDKDSDYTFEKKGCEETWERGDFNMKGYEITLGASGENKDTYYATSVKTSMSFSTDYK